MSRLLVWGRAEGSFFLAGVSAVPVGKGAVPEDEGLGGRYAASRKVPGIISSE